jgi:hypothetical protein
MSRYMSTITAVKTPFGSMFIHIEKEDGIPIGGWISNPLTARGPDVSRLIDCLSDGLNAAIKGMATDDMGADYGI